MKYNTKKIILISGKKGSGKTYTANKIADMLNEKPMGHHIVSFATALKESSNELIEKTFGKEYLNAEHKEEVRSIYQAVGNVGRNISKEFWVGKAIEHIKKLKDRVFIIDDARFQNEMELDQYTSGVEVLRCRVTRASEITGEDNDESETGLDHLDNDYFDIIIDGDEDITNSREKIMEFING